MACPALQCQRASPCTARWLPGPARLGLELALPYSMPQTSPDCPEANMHISWMPPLLQQEAVWDNVPALPLKLSLSCVTSSHYGTWLANSARHLHPAVPAHWLWARPCPFRTSGKPWLKELPWKPWQLSLPLASLSQGSERLGCSSCWQSSHGAGANADWPHLCGQSLVHVEKWSRL